MTSAEPRVGQALVSGRQLFICDNLVDAATVAQIGAFVKTLRYERKERARADIPPTAASADIPDATVDAMEFFAFIKGVAVDAFRGEKLTRQRVYVNSSTYGDMYHIHRDCSEGRNHVTILYYAHPEWQPDWGGETVFYDDNYDAQVVVSPRPGRLVVARGAILHRGTVPTRDCYHERLTVAYKLLSE